MAQPAADEESTLLAGPQVTYASALDFPEDRHESCAVNLAADKEACVEERARGEALIAGQRQYLGYSTIDWLHDLVSESYRYRIVHSGAGIVDRLRAALDSSAGWFAVGLMGVITAAIGYLIDTSKEILADWRLGYCKRNLFLPRQSCCTGFEQSAFTARADGTFVECPAFQSWSTNYWRSFAIYAAFAMCFGIISAGITTFSKRTLTSASIRAARNLGEQFELDDVLSDHKNKTMYMAAGSGIPEIKTILSGFDVPYFLDFKVLLVKVLATPFAVASGMSLGKEGPMVHTSCSVAFLVSSRLDKYANSGRKMREMLSAGTAAGLSTAFGTPMGGVMFSYEEFSSYFPIKVIWKAILCSICACVVLKALNPFGTGRLVLFPTDYPKFFLPQHYLVFMLLGVTGGVCGGLVCRGNYIWSKWFRSFEVVKKNSILEVAFVVMISTIVQYSNPLSREVGEELIRLLFVSCNEKHSMQSWVCLQEAQVNPRSGWGYVFLLASGCLAKLMLITITFGLPVPSGVLIPALGAGAFFGRLVGQFITTIEPGVFAMVGASAFLAGLSKMTIPLIVTMFELTGAVDYIVPHMIAIMVAKWTADSISLGINDLSKELRGHPFLNIDQAMELIHSQKYPQSVSRLIPPENVMDLMKVSVDQNLTVSRSVLKSKLQQLDNKRLDAGLVIVQDGFLRGYLTKAGLVHGLKQVARCYNSSTDPKIRLLENSMSRIRGDVLGGSNGTTSKFAIRDGRESALNLSTLVNKTPMAMSEAAPIEYAVEAFSKLGLQYLVITEIDTGKVIGVCHKKRLVGYLESLQS